LTYRAFRSFLRAVIWLTLGLLGGTFVSSLSVIGYFGALYYLFAALNTVTAVPDEDDAAKKVEEITSELKKLDEA
jgi:threonine/homoserine/homoserine lactone efflux protein